MQTFSQHFVTKATKWGFPSRIYGQLPTLWKGSA